MKRILLLTLLIFIGFFSMAQQWESTNLATFNFANTTLESHNNTLYSIYNTSLSGDVYTLDAGKTSWTQQTFSGVTGFPTFLESTGDKLYLGTVGLGFSMIYYTTDNGATFVEDTVGLPKFTSGVNTLYGFQFFNGKVVANMGSSGYWLKDTADVSWAQIDVPTFFNGGTDPLAFYNDSIYAFDNAAATTFYVSGDYGATWMTRTISLPASYKADLLIANASTGRLYTSGSSNSGAQYGVYYSDDHGFNWTEATNLNTFIGTDANGGQQEVTAMYANGNTIFMALENDASNSRPDVLSSSTGIANMAVDTVGLLTDPSGMMNGARFLEFQGDVYMGLNVRDVYRKSSSSTIGLSETNLNEVILYPNPSSEKIYFSGLNGVNNRVRIINTIGVEVINTTMLSNSIEISGLAKGIYVVQILSDGKLVETMRLFKN